MHENPKILSQVTITKRKKNTQEVIASLRLENIELDQETLRKIHYFDTHDISPEQAITDCYNELNALYGTDVKPPK